MLYSAINKNRSHTDSDTEREVQSQPYLVGSKDFFEYIIGEQLFDVSFVVGIELVLSLEHSVAQLNRLDRLKILKAKFAKVELLLKTK